MTGGGFLFVFPPSLLTWRRFPFFWRRFPDQVVHAHRVGHDDFSIQLEKLEATIATEYQAMMSMSLNFDTSTGDVLNGLPGGA